MPLFKADKIAQCQEFLAPFTSFSFLGPGGKREGLDLREIMAIMELARCKGQTPMSDLGRALGLSSTATTRLVSKLVEKDIFSTRDDPANRRKKLISITGKADDLLRQAGIAH